MIVISYKPVGWGPKTGGISISRLLATLASDRTNWVTVYLHNGVAYVVVREAFGGTIYRHLPEEQWNVVDHILKVSPYLCHTGGGNACRICKWRLSRKRYLNPLVEFKHITK